MIGLIPIRADVQREGMPFSQGTAELVGQNLRES